MSVQYSAAKDKGAQSVATLPPNQLRDGALALAARGMRVFPLEPNGKRPRVKWRDEATTDTERIDAWWSRWPDANVGLVTDGLAVIDLDSDGAEATLCDLEQQLGALPGTRVAETGRGSHWYFRVPEGATLRNKVKLADHVDLRADGGFVVAPPSVHENGTRYSWRFDRPVAQLPPAWVEQLREQRERSPIDLADRRPIPIGQQNDEIFRRVSALRARGEDYAFARTYVRMLDVPNDPSREPWTAADLDAIVERVYSTYEAGEQPAAVRHTAGIHQGANEQPPWETASEFCGRTPDETEWIVAPYIAVGDIVEIDGQPKRAGKSTLIAHMTRALTHGHDFLGGKTRKGHVVWLTEMDGSSLRECLEEAGLTSNNSLHLLKLTDMRGKSWDDLAGIAAAKCREVGAVLLVVDTVARWMRVHGDEGNAGGTWTERIEQLFPVKEAGTAVVLAHWERKSGGAVGESGSGSNTLAGVTDTIIKLSRIDGGSETRHRRLEAIGRHADTPEDVVIDLEPGQGYSLVGEGKSAVRNDAYTQMREALNDGNAWTLAELVTATGNTRATVQRVLKWMLDHDQIAVTPGSHIEGKRGSQPATYQLATVVRYAA